MHYYRAVLPLFFSNDSMSSKRTASQRDERPLCKHEPRRCTDLTPEHHVRFAHPSGETTIIAEPTNISNTSEVLSSVPQQQLIHQPLAFTFILTKALWTERRSLILPHLTLSGQPVAVLLDGCEGLLQVELDHLLDLLKHRIIVLDVSGCKAVRSLTHLDGSCLQELNVSNTSVTQHGLAGVVTPQLEVLKLRNCEQVSDLTTLLHGCTALKKLDIEGTSVTQAGIAGITAPLLEELYLARCHGDGVTDVTELLQNCKTLRILNVSQSLKQAKTISLRIEAPLLETLQADGDIFDTTHLRCPESVTLLGNARTRVSVTTNDRRSTVLLLSKEATVGAIRTAVGGNVGGLMFNGMLLQNHVTVGTSDIPHGTTLHEISPHRWFACRYARGGYTAARWAAAGGHIDVLDKVLKCRGATMREAIQMSNVSVLDLVVRGQIEVVQYLFVKETTKAQTTFR